MRERTRRYHHGNLRRTLMDLAVERIARDGVGGVSLRELARRAGVSHAAPVHHFGDKAGLLTAIAVEGFEELAAALRRAWEETGSFLEVGVAYVAFAIARPGHFAVMFRPDAYRRDDPALVRARAAARAVLEGTVGQAAGPRRGRDRARAAIAAWSLVHGLATLWLGGNLPPGEDPIRLARETARHLFGGAPPGRRRPRTRSKVAR
jgi:AcrR family transcriptional regulator